MKKNPIYQALSLLLKPTSLPILRFGLLEKGWIRFTDLDHELKVFVGDIKGESGLLDVDLLIKTENYVAALNAANGMKTEDFPNAVLLKEPTTEIPFKVLFGCTVLLPAISSDREPLDRIFFDSGKNAAVATDGRVLLMKKFEVEIQKGFLLDPMSLKVIECFGGNVSKSAVSPDQFICNGKGWQLISKTREPKDFPDYSKAIPEYPKTKAILWDLIIKREMASFLRLAESFSNKKTHLIKFALRKGIIENKEIRYKSETTFSKDIFAMKPDQTMGMNAKILKTIVEFFVNEEIRVSGGEVDKPVLFDSKSRFALLMPLRIV